jgi:uncharacterized protein (UPF0261 family)
MAKNIVVLASLDTKADEAGYLESRIDELGFTPIVVDFGYGGPPETEASITSTEVAAAVLNDIETVWNLEDTGEASHLMMNGAIIVVNRLLREGRCDGIIAFGGASNTTLATRVMQTVPVGVPKLMISSAAAMPAYSASYFGTKDITMMNAVVDFSGLNDLTRALLDAGAGAICGMAASTGGPVSPQATNRQVAVTGFRFSETCSRAVAQHLESLGYGVIPFHAQGVGENAMEELVGQGLFVGVVDVVPAGLSERLLGGNRAAHESRLEAAGKLGIPQVISTSGFDMISCGPLSRRNSGDALWEERQLARRKYSVPDRFRVEARTTADEVSQIGRLVAEKLNQATGPTRVVVPLRGWSSLSRQGEELHDPEADSAFVPALRAGLDESIFVSELDLELNTEEFGIALAESLHEMIQAQSVAPTFSDQKS